MVVVLSSALPAKNFPDVSLIMNKLLKSFTYAVDGIFYALSTQRNMKIHTVALTLVVIFGIYFNLSSTEWLAIIISSGIVISLEIINTAIENICDLLKEKLNLEFHHTTHARDLAAGAVLISAVSALLVGLVIFIPKFFAIILP